MKTLTLVLLLIVLMGCGAEAESGDEPNQDEQQSELIDQINQMNTGEFEGTEVNLPDGTSVMCVSYRGQFQCDWR